MIFARPHQVNTNVKNTINLQSIIMAETLQTPCKFFTYQECKGFEYENFSQKNCYLKYETKTLALRVSKALNTKCFSATILDI